MVFDDNDNIEKQKQKSVEHIINKCIAKHSDHAKICKTVAIFLAFQQYWIAMLCTKYWQTDKYWQNQKFRVEAEFMKNRIDHSVNIFAFELETAEWEITKDVQCSVFKSRFMHISSNIENYESNINRMHTKKDLKKELRLISNLKPYIDAEGILRVYGRLDKSDFAFQVCHHMILPKCHSYTECVISDIHRKSNIQVPCSP